MSENVEKLRKAIREERDNSGSYESEDGLATWLAAADVTDTAGRNPPVMPPGRELDALVGEIVFGFWFEQGRWWGKHPTMPGNRAYASCAFSRPLFGPSYDQSNGLPKFSTSWDAMRLVVERLVALGYYVQLEIDEDGPRCVVVRDGDAGLEPNAEIVFSERGDTLPHAVCLAALAALKAVTSAQQGAEPNRE